MSESLRAGLARLMEQLRAEGARCDSFHATMGTGYKESADRIAALLLRTLPAQEPEPEPVRVLVKPLTADEWLLVARASEGTILGMKALANRAMMSAREAK